MIDILLFILLQNSSVSLGLISMDYISLLWTNMYLFAHSLGLISLTVDEVIIEIR